MRRDGRHRTQNRDLKLVFIVASTFALTIASFVASRAITEVQSRSIAEQADTIADNALVATEKLIEVRTELREVAVDLTRIRESVPSDELASELERDRHAVRAGWDGYVSVPFLPTEEELASRVEEELLRGASELEAVVARLRAGDREGAMLLADERVIPIIVRVAEGFDELLQLNRRVAQDAASQIAHTTRSRGFLLDLIGVCSALAAMFFGMRVLRHYLAVSAERSAELESFAGRVAHDIRSPLGAASLALDVAKRSPGVDPQTQALLARVTRSMQRVAELVDGLLVFATSGGYIVEGEGVETHAPLRTVLDGVVQDAMLEAEKLDIHLEYEPPDPSLVVACSRGVLISMTANLLSNAMKYMGSSPVRRISVRVRRSAEEEVRVEVDDTGPGIPAEMREAVFKPFVRGTTTASGFGLGLATVRKLADAHGGEAGIEAGAERGCTAWFTLPIWVEAREQRATSSWRPFRPAHRGA